MERNSCSPRRGLGRPKDAEYGCELHSRVGNGLNGSIRNEEVKNGIFTKVRHVKN
jgi:hypothetical protein